MERRQSGCKLGSIPSAALGWIKKKPYWLGLVSAGSLIVICSFSGARKRPIFPKPLIMTIERLNLLVEELDVRIDWLNAKAASFTHNTQARKKYLAEIMREERRKEQLVEQLNQLYKN